MDEMAYAPISFPVKDGLRRAPRPPGLLRGPHVDPPRSVGSLVQAVVEQYPPLYELVVIHAELADAVRRLGRAAVVIVKQANRARLRCRPVRRCSIAG